MSVNSVGGPKTDMPVVHPLGIEAVRLLAFYPIDFPTVSVDGQWPKEDIAEIAGSPGWRTPAPTADLALQSYGARVLDELLHSMPRALLETSGGLELLESAGLTDEEVAPVLNPSGDGSWRLVHTRISLWNVGIGLAVFTYDLPPVAWSDLPALVPGTRNSIYGMVPGVRRLTQALVARGTTTSRRHADQLTVLWGNPNYFVRVAPTSNREARFAIAGTVTTDGPNCIVEEYPASAIRIGRHCSVVGDSFEDGAMELVVRLAGVHQVCWATSLIHDAKLASEVSRIAPGESAPSISELRDQAGRILRQYHQVRSFRLRYSSVEPHLTPSAAVVWRTLEEGWKFQGVIAVLDDRLAFVQTLHQQIFSTVSDHRSRLLNDLVAAFTFLNIFSIVIAALTFGALPAVDQRIVPLEILAVTLVVNTIAYLIFRRRVNRHR